MVIYAVSRLALSWVVSAEHFAPTDLIDPRSHRLRKWVIKWGLRPSFNSLLGTATPAIGNFDHGRDELERESRQRRDHVNEHKADQPSVALCPMATVTAQYHISLARALPAQLQRFLARYPHPSILPSSAAASAATTNEPQSLATDASSAAATATAGPDARASSQSQSSSPSPWPTFYQQATPNPFLPTKNPETGRWRPPVYSARRQAQLAKLARAHSVESLLPWTKKLADVRLAQRVEFGLRVKGTGVGQRVKGHKFERELIPK